MKRFLIALVALLLVSSAAFAGGPPAEDPKARIWPDESIYFIMIDRFHNGDTSNDQGTNPTDIRAWHGGDLQGIIEKLDYIKSMGFTAIWITPHVKNTGNDYHGYGAVDFFDTDPHFGTVAKTAELVEKAHAKGIKVIFDIVVNHTGPKNPLVYEKPDWFHPRKGITNWSDQKQLQEGWIFDLPDFDQSKPEVRDYILSYSKFWIEKTGVDGFRIDTARHVPADFFTWYNAELQKIKPGFWLIGEVWENVPWKLALYQEAGITAMLDFPNSEAARNVFAKGTPMTGLASMTRQVSSTMADPWQMGAFLDNHDMARFITHAGQDSVPKLKVALTWLFTQRSIPILYSGTEIGMAGGNDPYNRVDFPWDSQQNADVRELVTKLNTIRRDHPALRRGTLEELAADTWSYAYGRQSGSDTVVVVLNNHERDALQAEIDVSKLGLAAGTVLTDALTGKTVRVEGGKIMAEAGPKSGAIYATPAPKALAGGIWLWATAGAVALGGSAAVLMMRRRRKG